MQKLALSPSLTIFSMAKEEWMFGEDFGPKRPTIWYIYLKHISFPFFAYFTSTGWWFVYWGGGAKRGIGECIHLEPSFPSLSLAGNWQERWPRVVFPWQTPLLARHVIQPKKLPHGVKNFYPLRPGIVPGGIHGLIFILIRGVRPFPGLVNFYNLIEPVWCSG